MEFKVEIIFTFLIAKSWLLHKCIKVLYWYFGKTNYSANQMKLERSKRLYLHINLTLEMANLCFRMISYIGKLVTLDRTLTFYGKLQLMQQYCKQFYKCYGSQFHESHYQTIVSKMHSNI